VRLNAIRLTIQESNAAIEKAAKQTDTDPTDDQKESGNYKKGQVNLHGMQISIENPKGSERSGTDSDGNEWSTKMNHHYGYIKGTKGRDKDHLDVFLGPDADDPELDVFVVDQVRTDTKKFDEHKVLMGFKDKPSAKKGYLSCYEDGWQGIGAITKMSLGEFKEWINGSTMKPVDDSVKI
jgi:hypothetical protein